MIKRENIAFEVIPAAGIHGIGLKSLPGNILRLTRGYFASRRIIRSFKPDVLLFTGGYVAVPMALAGIPLQSLLYVPDIEPGLALKTLARFSDQIALTTSESKHFFSGHRNTAVTGYPTRADISDWTREKAEQFFNLSKEKPVVLILGGSKGARSINQAVEKHLNELLTFAQIIHISGTLDFQVAEHSREQLADNLKANYHLYPYLHNIGAALAAADLAISRAGASTLGEYPLFGLPAILIPYPYAWRYQKVNADYLAQNGAALVLEDSRLMEELIPMVKSLLSDHQKLALMRNSMKSLGMPGASDKIAGMLINLSTKKTGRIQL
jgi:UDP-N-acetylglucosamine--N-acetylmuramyl-(pentapeptide) pyrophosphoryl-undecaprenol N-acetylglucosamine transferase